MAFDLEKLFVDVFAPRLGDVVTVIYDLPHGEIRDREEWRLRREMASAWHGKIGEFASRYGLTVNPIVTYQATGAHNSDLPPDGMSEGQAVRLEDIIKGSTIVVCMPEFSASAPLFMLTKKYEHLRVASMPGVTKSMEDTGLAANYKETIPTSGIGVSTYPGTWREDARVRGGPRHRSTCSYRKWSKPGTSPGWRASRKASAWTSSLTGSPASTVTSKPSTCGRERAMAAPTSSIASLPT
jgi:hypothetical protein